jgi:uncharacterized membrane protein YhiD involved in acid resistance
MNKFIFTAVLALSLTACASSSVKDLNARVDALDARVTNQQTQINTLNTRADNADIRIEQSLQNSVDANIKINRMFHKAMIKGQ